jgi:hypothetical protein
MSLRHRIKINWATPIIRIRMFLPIFPEYFSRFAIRKRVELPKAQSRLSQCRKDKGRMHSRIAGMKQNSEYPYRQIIYIMINLPKAAQVQSSPY